MLPRRFCRVDENRSGRSAIPSIVLDLFRKAHLRSAPKGLRMLAIPRSSRLIASLAVAVLVVLLAIVPARRGMGQGAAGEAAALPADLLKAQPFDRITLTDNSVWIIEPVSPRPLPVFDVVKAREAAKAE